MTSPRLTLLAVGLAGLVAVSGCAKKAPEPPPAPPPATTPAPPPPPPPPPPKPAPEAPKPLTEEEIFARMSLEELNAKKPLEDVFFAFDSSELSEPARQSLSKNQDWLRKWTSTRISIEGHCDSRGTSEYNIALGERRANAVRDYLVSLGVPAERIITVSKGEESPFCTEENEGCWSQNRRGHFIITAK
ncbi:MAG: peptidoglycan-associated lipoprotein Pal [Vicinamibacteraceae bacterium]|nr:peptidoglycan-associated lipoprotein Pal [Vicinamibacteraceae bacterium]